MKGKQAVLDEIDNNLALLMQIEGTTIDVMKHKNHLIDVLEDAKGLLHFLQTKEQALEYIDILTRYEEIFGPKIDTSNMLHIINRVLKGEE